MSKETKKKGTKKPYQKPEIVFEDFSLTTNIAAGCEHIANQSEDICGVLYDELENMYIFNVGNVSGCNTQGNENICYHVPTEASNVFNS